MENNSSRRIFRKVALERLSSPEQLDQLMRITTPAGWVTLLGLGGLLVCAVIWGLWGSIPTRLEGQGILMKRGGVYSISCRGSGRVKRLLFGVGDMVRAGQVVAVIGQPDTIDKIADAKEKVRQAQVKHRQVRDFSIQEIRLNSESVKQQLKNLVLTNEALQERLGLLEEQLRDQKRLVKLGLITKQKVISTEQDINTAKQQFRSNRNSLKQLNIKKLQLENQIRQKLLDLQDEITNAGQELQDLQDNLTEKAKIVSPFTGEIVGMNVDLGDVVQPGSSLMTAQPTGPNAGFLEAIMYFTSEGKKIRPGMKAQITPTVVKKERYGSIIGLVTHVSPFPANPKEMNSILLNENLVKSLSKKGSSFEVRIALVPDPGTTSGYKWTSSQGPPLSIGPGMIAAGSVIVERQPPIQLVIPLMKKYILGVGVEEDRRGM
jgi:HlyD family secretion protein